MDITNKMTAGKVLAGLALAAASYGITADEISENKTTLGFEVHAKVGATAAKAEFRWGDEEWNKSDASANVMTVGNVKIKDDGKAVSFGTGEQIVKIKSNYTMSVMTMRDTFDMTPNNLEATSQCTTLENNNCRRMLMEWKQKGQTTPSRISLNAIHAHNPSTGGSTKGKDRTNFEQEEFVEHTLIVRPALVYTGELQAAKIYKPDANPELIFSEML